MAFARGMDVYVASRLLAAAREMKAAGRKLNAEMKRDPRPGRTYTVDNTVNVRRGVEPELTLLARLEAVLMQVLTRVVDDNTKHAEQLRKELGDSENVFAALERLRWEWFPQQCWNAFCIVEHCPGDRHVDVTGHSWEQREGYAYNPASGKYNLPEDEQTGPVVTVYRRDAYLSEILHDAVNTDGTPQRD